MIFFPIVRDSIFVIIIYVFNPLNAESYPICHLLALLGAHHILHISRIRVKLLELSPPLLLMFC